MIAQPHKITLGPDRITCTCGHLLRFSPAWEDGDIAGAVKRHLDDVGAPREGGREALERLGAWKG